VSGALTPILMLSGPFAKAQTPKPATTKKTTVAINNLLFIMDLLLEKF
jgi:hypothetical protein